MQPHDPNDCRVCQQFPCICTPTDPLWQGETCHGCGQEVCICVEWNPELDDPDESDPTMPGWEA